MPQRKPTDRPDFSFLTAYITGYKFTIDALVNPMIHNKKFRHDDTPVYDFKSDIEISSEFTDPKTVAGHRFILTIYGSEPTSEGLSITLKNCHVRDDMGTPMYQRKRGQESPVYKIPHGIGLIEKIRSEQAWQGWVWVKPQVVSDMLSVLPHTAPLYMNIHQAKIGRVRWIAGLTLQNTNPEYE